MSTCIGIDRTVTARTKHECVYCKTSIFPGEKYGKRAGVDLCGFWSMEFHPECDAHANTTWKPGDWYDHDWADAAFERPKQLTK